MEHAKTIGYFDQTYELIVRFGPSMDNKSGAVVRKSIKAWSVFLRLDRLMYPEIY